MRLLRLRLRDYRNFERLDLDLAGDAILFVGDNARGKSNLLEAISLLSTMRAPRAEADAQLIRRAVLQEVIPAASVSAQAEMSGGVVQVEVVITARAGPQGPIASKTVRVNGVPKRSTEAIGVLASVLFSADDLEIVTGSPSARRRHLDTALMQVDRQYTASRQKYDRVLQQRNHLLKRIREGGARPEELEFWDEQLCQNGAVIMRRRADALAELARSAARFHPELAPGESLELRYEPRLDEGAGALTAADEPAIAGLFRESLGRGLRRDIAAGMTLSGPHRDDVAYLLDAAAAAHYASRAQQRTVALSLRLAEVRLLASRRDEAPILLLDDVLSEMDAQRRGTVLAALAAIDQVIVTSADRDRFPSTFLDGAEVFAVEEGGVRPLSLKPAWSKTADS